MTTPDFEGLLAALLRARFDFVVVGGYSAMLDGGTLMTRDIDVVCPLVPGNLWCLWTALSGLHPVHRMDPALPFTEKDLDRSDWQTLHLQTALGVLDCLGTVRGLGSYEVCRARSSEVLLGGGLVRILSLEALIEAKLAMGRSRELQTAAELELILQRRPDRTN